MSDLYKSDFESEQERETQGENKKQSKFGSDFKSDFEEDPEQSQTHNELIAQPKYVSPNDLPESKSTYIENPNAAPKNEEPIKTEKLPETEIITEKPREEDSERKEGEEEPEEEVKIELPPLNNIYNEMSSVIDDFLAEIEQGKGVKDRSDS